MIDELQSRMDRVLREVEQEESWKFLYEPTTTAAEIEQFLSEVFLRVFWYQPHTTEAGFHMIGRLPKTEGRLLRSLLTHKAEEAEHGGWAFRDYVALGGCEKTAYERKLTPACFAVAAVWWQMAEKEEPFGYLGAEYLFEELTARVCAKLVPLFHEKGVCSEKIGFIVEHATEDLKHSKLIRHWISKVETRFPHSRAAMLRCFDYFNHVYPIPVWREAYDAVLVQPKGDFGGLACSGPKAPAPYPEHI